MGATLWVEPLIIENFAISLLPSFFKKNMRKDEFIKKVNSYLHCGNTKESFDFAIKFTGNMIPKKTAQKIAIIEHLERLDKYEKKR